MVIPTIDTPRTDFGASITQTRHHLADFTQSSIPSPAKERNELIRGLRGPGQRTPRARLPFADRHNFPNGKPEFTPLLKSATRNRSAYAGKENLGLNGHKPTTPAGFRESYRSDLPDLPENSSVLYEDDTGSEQGKQATPQLPKSSSSVMSTPVPPLDTKGRSGLGEAQFGNLREQEARVEQLDKENFGLKLKIHYLEEAYRKSGKEFNEALVKQLTDIQVDKLTLQRDLKHYRRQLGQLQKDSEASRRSGNESVNAELDRLQQALEEREAEIGILQESAGLERGQEQEIGKLRDEVADLEHELRQKDQELDEKDDEIEELKTCAAPSDEIDELKAQLQERDEDIKGLQDALRTASAEHDRKLGEKDRALELKDDEVRDVEEELKNAGRGDSFAVKRREVEHHQSEIARLEQELEQSTAAAKQDLADLRTQLETIERRSTSEAQHRAEEVQRRDDQIRALEQKLNSGDDREANTERLQDQVSDLESDLRLKDRTIEEREDLVDELRSKIQQIENDSDEELMAAQDRIQELETQQQRHLKELQALRDVKDHGEVSRSEALETAASRIAELESASIQARDAEQQMRKELHRLKDDVRHLENALDDKEKEAKDTGRAWDRERSLLEADRSQAEQKVKSLESAIAQLRESEGTLSGKGMILQKMLEDGKKQQASALTVLQGRLDDAVDERDRLRTALQQTTSQLREVQRQDSTSSRDLRAVQDKVQSLEDEIEVLQSTHEEPNTQSKDELAALRSESESLRRQMAGLKQDLSRAESEHALTKAQLSSTTKTEPARTPPPKATPPTTRLMRQRVQKLEDDVQAAARLEAQLKEVDNERRILQQRLSEAEARRQSSPDDAATLVDHSSPSKSPARSRQRALESEITALRGQLNNLHEQKNQLEDDLDLLTSDLESATNARDAALDTMRSLRKQLIDVTRAAEHKYHNQVAEYERDISNLEDELSSARASQREHEIKAESTSATVTRLRKRLEGVENELATSRARERTSSESPEAGRRERRELQDALRKAEHRAEELLSKLSDRDVDFQSVRSRHSDLQAQVQTLQQERRNAQTRAENLASDLHALRTASLDEAAVSKLTNRHAAELRGLVKQIQYLSAKCARAERLRQDAAFAKGYVGKVVEVYARVHKMDMRLVREMGISVPLVDEDEVRQRRLGGGVDATPRRTRNPLKEESPPLRRRAKKLSLLQVALALRAGIRMSRRCQEWTEVRRSHEGVLRKWKTLRDERRGGMCMDM